MREYLTKKELSRLKWQSIERLQNKRFKAIARHLMPYVKAYSDIFTQRGVNPKKIKTVEHWHKFGLPLFKKKHYIKNPKDFIVAPDAEQVFSLHRKFLGTLSKIEELNFIMTALLRPRKTKEFLKSVYKPKMPFFSGGTESGNPTPVFITSQQKKLMEKIIEQVVNVVQEANDFKTDSVVGMNLFPYGPHLAWHATHLAIDIAADINLSTAAGGCIPTEKLAKLAATFKPKIFAGMHSYMKDRFFTTVAQQKTELPIRALIINGAEKMTLGDRETLAKTAQKTGIIQPIILDLYGASELKENLLPECTPNSGFHHISPLSTIIRTVKAEPSVDDALIDKWEFTKPEEGGYGALWNIDGAGTLFEGYLIGDNYEKISQDKCEHCGLMVERIHNINRIRDIQAQQLLTGIVEEKIKGTRINLTEIRDDLLKQEFVKEAQLVVEKQGKGLIVRFASDLKPAEAIIKMRKTLESLDITPKIELVTIEKLVVENKKFEPFVVR